MQVGIRELKSGLSRVLAQAQAGVVVEVTSHNRAVARIVGIPAQGAEGMRQLVASGAVSWAGGKPEFASPIQLSPSGKPLSQMVLEDRG